MYIKQLHIKNIGPFSDEKLEFVYNGSENGQPVNIITGVNGAGKSIIIDAIRAALCGGEPVERDIVADASDFVIEMDVVLSGKDRHLKTDKIESGHIKFADWDIARPLIYGYQSPRDTYSPWVIDYWSSRTATDSFLINSIGSIDHHKVLENALSGNSSNLQLTNFICNVDYLRSSDVPDEKEAGEFLFGTLKNIIDRCLDNGTFRYVRRTDLQPVVEQNGNEVTLEKLSSGNIFLIEHLVLLMCKMYSLSVLRGTPVCEILKTPGLLLIDEIETHLHPRWQKDILGIIRELFPAVQIILTTHSPFILSSLDDIRIYTCKPQIGGGSRVFDETDVYASMPVDEILMSDAFNVLPFNNKITGLLNDRKDAIKERDMDRVNKIEAVLMDTNPEYFAYMELDKKFDGK